MTRGERLRPVTAGPAAGKGTLMRIGELARQAGVSSQGIRFYERRKLLRLAPRTASGYRVYSAADLEVVRAIKEYQELGFTLREIKQFLELHTSARLRRPAGSHGLEPAAAMAREKLRSIDEKMGKLRSLRRELSRLLGLLETRAEAACPVARTRALSDRGSSPRVD
jgi:DNA-binding transcriptional MerR regulator